MRNLLAAREPVFTVKQFDRLSNIFDNAGQVIFGIVVIGPTFSNSKINIATIVVGAIAAFTLWIGSMLLAKRGE